MSYGTVYRDGDFFFHFHFRLGKLYFTTLKISLNHLFALIDHDVNIFSNGFLIWIISPTLKFTLLNNGTKKKKERILFLGSFSKYSTFELRVLANSLLIIRIPQAVGFNQQTNGVFKLEVPVIYISLSAFVVSPPRRVIDRSRLPFHSTLIYDEVYMTEMCSLVRCFILVKWLDGEAVPPSSILWRRANQKFNWSIIK
ncbi:hypothetical protein T4D_9693 [Trichinella pseudospiralis]|uniref:Uncharacterized protein n=1 Tax=Trichinella pseudospiralis TaxID=6337 RepID=A0A0V1FTV3_TRIPS|nr:hypothetical protein T4D_9693 [Trichinella pseudospiralis]